MTVERVLILCNAMSDVVRNQRGITTDSPAATRKIVMMAQVLAQGGVRPTLLSLGRGRADGSPGQFPAQAGRIGHIPIAYGRFTRRRFLSEWQSLVAPFPILWSRRRHARHTTLLLYNRMDSHVPALWFARLLGYRTMLDLEDGQVLSAERRVAPRVRMLIAATDRGCRNGALLACKALAESTRLRPALAYYGVVDISAAARDFTEPVIHALIGGTVARDTGAEMLAAAIMLLRTGYPDFAEQFHLHVSGSGDMVATFRDMAARMSGITVHGRLNDDTYRALLDQCSIGLALKPNGGRLADTTFPSKVTELAGAGMLVLTTDISDVRDVLGEGAVYLIRNDPALLADAIAGILRDRKRSAALAEIGQANVSRRCARGAVASQLALFVSGNCLCD
jgi:hypothetical protein